MTFSLATQSHLFLFLYLDFQYVSNFFFNLIRFFFFPIQSSTSLFFISSINPLFVTQFHTFHFPILHFPSSPIYNSVTSKLNSLFSLSPLLLYSSIPFRSSFTTYSVFFFLFLLFNSLPTFPSIPYSTLFLELNLIPFILQTFTFRAVKLTTP